jgi:hypothetical protein
VTNRGPVSLERLGDRDDARRHASPSAIAAVMIALSEPPLAERLISYGIDRSFRNGPKPSDRAPLLG